MLDFPIEHLLVYGGLVVRKELWLALTSVCVAVALYWAAMHWAARFGRFTTTATLVLMAIVAFALARSAGLSVALADFAMQRHNDYSAYPRVRVSWTTKDAPTDTLMGDIFTTDCARLLAASKDRLFLIRPIRGAADADLDTFALPLNKVIFRIRADYTSCP